MTRLLLLGGYFLLVPALAWPQSAFFNSEPFWESPEPNTTRSVALGDVDLDGDVDLVCGNSQQANTLFLNEGGTFGIVSAWSPNAVDRTRSIALGDLDGDGDLDVVCGNFGGVNTIYLNQGGAFDPMPADTLRTSNTAESVALGDVDNDGDLDVVFGIPLFPNAVYINDAGRFPDPPQLIGGANETRSVALGDLDADGYLDLVQGNVLGALTPARTYVYLNTDGVLDSLPGWASEVGKQTLGVALADIDGNGRLDLVCANLDQPNTIYYGRGDSLLEAIPSWQSTPVNSSEDVDVGDVDSDGDLDLVFANRGQPSALYLNDPANPDVIALAPAWSTGREDRTIDVALGDVDGDGDLDLVCGNSDQLSTAYLNLTPALEIVPSWDSDAPAPNRTKSVALGDVDNDGDLDLACGNGGANPEVNTFYLNNAGRLEETPSWSSVDPRRAASVVLAKVDRDDRIDLICGNQGDAGEENTVFQNNGDPFATTPTWTSVPQEVTTSIAAGDVNGDGFLDLVCGNGGEESSVYLNLGSTFDTNPAWRSSLALRTSGIALGDVDGDDDLDLVCGNNGDPNTLYLNEGKMFAVDPAWSSSQALFTTDVALGDIDGDGDLDLVFANNPQATTAYFNEGGTFPTSAGWSSRPPARATTSLALGDLNGDGALDLVCGNEIAQPNPTAYNTAYMNEGGMLSRSPGWESGVSRDTEDVALGDVDGDGDLDAVFGNENGPNTLHAGNKNPPYRGDPLSPSRHQTNNSAFLKKVKVSQTGPNTHRIVFSLVDIESDPAWILAEYQFEGDPAWYPADVNNRVGRVGMFVTSPAATEDSLTWNTSRIPSDPRDIVLRLTTIEVPQRVAVVRSTPSYLVDVGQIPLVDTFARPSSGFEFFETRDIIVELRLPPGVTRDQARFHYRRGGESVYQEALFEDGSPLPFATIPSEWVGSRGIEYWVEAETPAGILTDPRTNPSLSPHAIRVKVTNLGESGQHPGRRYRLMSIPLEMESSVSIIRVLQDDVGFPDATRWRLFAYQAADSFYLEVPNDSTLAFEQGRGYWLITRDTHRLDTAPVFGESAPTDSAFALELAPGWNLIGQPFAFPVSWASVGVDSNLVEPPVAWRGDHYVYDVDRLEPWEGYWVRNRSGSTLRLKIPPEEATTPSITSDRTIAGATVGASEREWRVSISASSGGAIDPYNIAGTKDGSRDEWDAADRSDAPMSLDRSVSLYFPHRDGKVGDGNYAIDIRGDYEQLDDAMVRSFGLGPDLWGHLWSFDIAKSFAEVPAGDEVSLEFSGIDGLPAGARALLVDRDLKRVIDLQQYSRYLFYQGKRDFITNESHARFVLLVGSEAFADSRQGELPETPVRTSLHQNRPNPFNPVTIIRYEIAEAVPVAIRVYDVSGARVRDLYLGDRQPGIYEVSWDATNDAGEPVGSGIYFCRLAAGQVTETRKMLLLK
jgi:FG-GAP-like repeat/FlgD Ig-like domain